MEGNDALAVPLSFAIQKDATPVSGAAFQMTDPFGYVPNAGGAVAERSEPKAGVMSGEPVPTAPIYRLFNAIWLVPLAPQVIYMYCTVSGTVIV